jgi:prepilin-type N-terminal cleavage/methylation domain-containing protein
MTRRSADERGFTLVEVMIALGIMALGITAVIGVFTMATGAHRRAVDETSAAILAESAVAEVRGALTAAFDAGGLEVLSGGPGAVTSGLADVPPPVLAWKREARDPAFPGYAYDVLLTPIDAAKPANADLFHVEVRVRWLATGKVRGETYHTAILRSVAARDMRE